MINNQVVMKKNIENCVKKHVKKNFTIFLIFDKI